MSIERPHCTPGLRFYQWMMEKQRDSRLDNQARLRELKRAHGEALTLFFAHDLTEFEALAARPRANATAGIRSPASPSRTNANRQFS
jgi:hypothetical protein